MKIFINNINTYSGSCLCKTLDNIQNEKCEIYGTLISQNESNEEDMCMYNYDNVKKIVSKTNKDRLLKYIVMSNLCIFDMHNTCIDEIEYIIRKLRNEEIKTKITFILISSIMTWNKTKRKFFKKKIEENAEGKIGENAETNDTALKTQASDKINSIDDFQKNSIDKYRYIPEIFSEKDYLKRIPSSDYKELKTIETLILSLNSVKNINTYVVASGILYGNGENVFFPIFKNAWFSKDNQIIDKGDNYIPVIHIKGLCEYIKNVFLYEPKIKYLIAVDQEYVTQKDIIKSVANYISGNNNYLSVSSYDSIFIKDSDKLCINLRFQCTQFWNPNQINITDEEKKDSPEKDENGSDKNESDENDNSQVSSEENNDDEQDEQDENSEHGESSDHSEGGEHDEHDEGEKHEEGESCVKFHCQDGFTKNISILSTEFCEYRNLKSLKIIILGPPGVGKTFIAKKICEHYNLKMCSIQILLDECKKNNYNFPEYYKNSLNNIEKVDKLNLNDLSFIFYKKLKSNECKFRGYVLDSFPRNYDEAKIFFENYSASNLVTSSDGLTFSQNESMKKSHKKNKIKNEKQRSNDGLEGDEASGEETESEMDDESKEDEQSNSSSKKRSTQSGTSQNEDESENENESENEDESENDDETNESPKKNKKSDAKNDKEENKECLYNDGKNIQPNNNPILPEFVIILKSNEDLCKSRMMNLPKEEIIKGHNDEKGFERRYNKYVEENCRNDYLEFDKKNTIEDYFIENEIEVLNININEKSILDDILTNIYIYIEKNKKFYNFLPSTDEILKNKLHEQEIKLLNEKENLQKSEDNIANEELNKNDELIKAEKKRQQLLMEYQQQYIHNQSLPLRFYLIKNILPILTDALIYICKTKPKNPCLHIAEYLLENAHKYNVDENTLPLIPPKKNEEQEDSSNDNPKETNIQ
ncbi:P-loop containing nucleoside triphosphate hydrolase, putative [Plasmodium chabaudi chabaudi]|uniref:P-loop containing nucleoside triphosphate hydrolase, putative n=1 Tax=Plasmodium chabaudi chabaudi TaxID=31271 RepID=A0A4V0K2V4_PLACU|nr:P-loop containing nucleoside triphosphate hydrolase, putative [Plasmodium chabaudi chabaudi]VTZ67178.1 P-loop containing nucleoside triphosphate hydrolase, putative [Plasmodium chabaudi chabaudi]|eukprot:XP_016653268.1 P-loop containing nucleoside triphosphate hydrolase, putative [Plasmodium chabaudi chabaudi]